MQFPFPKMFPQPIPIPEEEQFDEFLEWTPEEEEAFLKIIDDQKEE